MQCQVFFDQLWRDYIQLTPQAARIHHLFSERGDDIVNDHVAFRTFNLPPVNLASLEPMILALGYRRFEAYRFANKHLDAWAYLPDDSSMPRIFFSELRVDALAADCRQIVEQLVAQVDPASASDYQLFFQGRPWAMPGWPAYQRLLQDSEYAAWLSVMGLRANHFTVSVNALDPPDLQQVISRLQQAGFALNEVGGVIKGSPEQLLEQASTLADSVTLPFSDGDTHTVKTCYYEFAKRYADASGALYQGFVPASADSIFHSTDSNP